LVADTRDNDQDESIRHQFGAEVRRLRRAADLSQARLAARLGYSRAHLALVETGREIPAQEFVRRLDAALDTAGELLDLYRQVVSERVEASRRRRARQVEQRSVSRRAVLAGLLTTGATVWGESLLAAADISRRAMDRTLELGSIGPADVNDLEEQAAKHAQDAIWMPPAQMVGRLLLDFSEVQQLAAERQALRVQEDLYRLAAQLAALVADEMMVLGDVPRSAAWHATARRAADETSDIGLRAQVRTLGAMLPLYYGDPAQSAALAREAQALLSGPCNAAFAQAPTIEAFALARLGNPPESRSVLLAAGNAFDRLTPQHQANSVFGFSERRWRFYEGRTLTLIGDFDRAWTSQDEALALYPDGVVGDPALVRIDRARLLIQEGRVDEGCQMAREVLLALPPEHRADIFVTDARAVLTAVPERCCGLRAVHEYRELLHELSSTELQ
jgi:transcriptional regulator with XRE-family HTH domain